MVVCGNSGAHTRGRRVIGGRAASARLAVPVSSRSLDPKPFCSATSCHVAHRTHHPVGPFVDISRVSPVASIPQPQIRPFASRQTAGSLPPRPTGCRQSDGLTDWRMADGGRHSAPTCTYAAAPSCIHTRANGRHPACPYSWMPVASACFAVCKPRPA